MELCNILKRGLFNNYLHNSFSSWIKKNMNTHRFHKTRGAIEDIARKIYVVQSDFNGERKEMTCKHYIGSLHSLRDNLYLDCPKGTKGECADARIVLNESLEMLLFRCQENNTDVSKEIL